MPAAAPSARPETTALASEIRLAVTRLSRRLRRERPTGTVTPSQISALNTLDIRGQLSPTGLAEYERVQPPSMTRIIGVLEERGLITRAPHPTDRRQFVLELTAEGRALVSDEKRRREAWLAMQISTLNDDECEALAKALPIIEHLASS